MSDCEICGRDGIDTVTVKYERQTSLSDTRKLSLHCLEETLDICLFIGRTSNVIISVFACSWKWYFTER